MKMRSPTRDTVKSVATLVDWISLCIELPLICWAIFALYHQVKADNVTAVYIINLLISDIIQFIGRVRILIYQHVFMYLSHVPFWSHWIMFTLFPLGLVASCAFMLCIALERYMCIVHPLWYRTRRSIKQSVLISLAAWVVSILITVLYYTIWVYDRWRIIALILIFICALIAFPLLVFFLLATWRALSHSEAVPVPEKKRIRRILVLVLGNYTVIFLPIIYVGAYAITEGWYNDWLDIYYDIANMFLYISPLMDVLLYFLLRKNTIPPCCGRLICCQKSRETPPTQTECDETECDETESLRLEHLPPTETETFPLEPLHQVSDTSV